MHKQRDWIQVITILENHLPSGSAHVRSHTVSTLVLTLLYVFSGSNKSLDQFQYSDKDIADTITACASKVSFVVLYVFSGSNKSLDQFQYSDKDIADMITACASKVSFVGLNGLIEFDKFGDPSINVQISQIQGNNS